MELATELVSVDDLLNGKCGRLSEGDVLAFNGASKVDTFIQDATFSKISHVAVLMREDSEAPLSVLEATGAGVTVTALDASLEKYKDDHVCFYLPLTPESRGRVDAAALAAYYATNVRQRYNYSGVFAAGLYELDNPLFGKLMDHVGANSRVARAARWWEGLAEKVWDEVFELNPDYRRLFCSQLVTEALLATRLPLAGPPNARLVVPIEVCWFGVFARAYQLNGALLARPFRWGAAPITPPGGIPVTPRG
jgi:hypothetical protein